MPESNPLAAIVPFNYGELTVRTVTIDGEPRFVAADVCAALDLADVRRAVERLDEADRSQTPVSSGGQHRQMWVVNESGLYDLIIRSDKPEAKPFRRWITSEVLPQIRRTGAYVPAQRAETAPASQLDLIIAVAQELKRAEQTAQRALESSEVTNARLDAIEGKHDWFAGLAYAKLNGLPTSTTYLQRLGKAAGKIGRARGLSVSKVQHGLYGEVNQWPVWVWELAVEERRAS